MTRRKLRRTENKGSFCSAKMPEAENTRTVSQILYAHTVYTHHFEFLSVLQPRLTAARG